MVFYEGRVNVFSLLITNCLTHQTTVMLYQVQSQHVKFYNFLNENIMSDREAFLTLSRTYKTTVSGY